MKHNPNKFTMLLKKKAYKILNSRPLSPVLRDDFSLRSLLISGTTKKRRTFNRHVSGDTLYATPGCSRTCCLTGTSRSCSTLITEIVGIIPYREMIYTGPIDEFFDYRYGKLPYRSVEFKHETLNTPVHQPVAVVNYPNEHLYTRVTEFKYLTGQEHLKLASSTSTHVSRETLTTPYRAQRMLNSTRKQGAG